MNFDKCYFGDSLVAKKMLTAKEVFSKYKAGTPRTEISKAREEIRSSLTPEKILRPY